MNYWNIIKKCILELAELDVNIHPHFIYASPHSFVKYSDEFYSKFNFIKNYDTKEYTFHTENSQTDFSDIEVFNKKINQFKGWNCWNNNYEINLNCEINQFCFEGKKGIPYNFFKDITKIGPVKCPHNFCSCDGLLKIHKEK